MRVSASTRTRTNGGGSWLRSMHARELGTVRGQPPSPLCWKPAPPASPSHACSWLCLSSHTVSRRVLVDSLRCEVVNDNHQLGPSPPFCTEFCPQPGKQHLVAVADEEGVVTLLDVTKPAQEQAGA